MRGDVGRHGAGGAAGVPLEPAFLFSKELLQAAILKTPSETVRFSDTFDAPPHSIVTSACQLGLEGVIAKASAQASVAPVKSKTTQE
mgnify:CR=1 FL=1